MPAAFNKWTQGIHGFVNRRTHTVAVQIGAWIRGISARRTTVDAWRARTGRLFASRVSRAVFTGLYELAQRAEELEEGDIFERLLRALEVRVEIPAGDASRIPDSGAVVVAANHPTGLLDGAVVASLCLRRRPDVKILVNHLLPRHELLEPFLIRVDPYGGRGSGEANRRPLREALRWLTEGHLLITFPAGDVSRVDWRQGGVADPGWNPSIARLARLAQAAVLPCSLRAFNSAAFHLLGSVHPRLRTIQLPFEMLNKRGARVQVRFGLPVPFARLARLNDDAMIDHLQARTNLLGKCSGTESRACSAMPLPARVGSCRPGLLDRSLGRCCLVESADWAVALFRGSEDPELLREIGALREITFRAAGEGTGGTIDLDRFDLHYDQLVLWNLKDRAIAGGYRIGACSAILDKYGAAGLYTSTLFRFHPEFFRRLGPAAELGRSFVAPPYQIQYMPLLMLWRAIGAWVCRHPECRCLFGPVSISDAYEPATRLLLSIALPTLAGDRELSRFVKPRRPLRAAQERAIRREWQRLRLDRPEQLSEVVASIEPDGKGLPVLLRQYLRLGGRLLAFNVDPAFSNVLDGLVLVDLLGTDRTLLDRYLTPEGARACLARWSAAA